MGALTEHLRAEHQHLKSHLDAMLTTANAVGEAPLYTIKDLTQEVLRNLRHLTRT